MCSTTTGAASGARPADCPWLCESMPLNATAFRRRPACRRDDPSTPVPTTRQAPPPLRRSLWPLPSRRRPHSSLLRIAAAVEPSSSMRTTRPPLRYRRGLDHGIGMLRGVSAPGWRRHSAAGGAGLPSVIGPRPSSWADPGRRYSGALWGSLLRAFADQLADRFSIVLTCSRSASQTQRRISIREPRSREVGWPRQC